MTDGFTLYETALTRLLERLGSDHARYADALVYQQRLQENIAQARKYGESDILKHARAQIVNMLNRLALETVLVSFNELCGLARDESVPTAPIEPPDMPPPPSCPEPPAKVSPVTIPRRAWGLLVLLLLDFCLPILWGWCLFGDQPNLMAYLQGVLEIFGVLLAILSIIFVVRQPIALKDALRYLGTNQGWARIILGLTGLSIVMMLTFWPLGWVGKCGPTPTPMLTPTCAVTAPTDSETLFALIDAEVQAILGEDIELVKAIFAPDAIIRNEATDQVWSSPEMYYTEKFRNEIHCQIEHYDYRVLKVTDTEAWVTTANRGKWGWETTGCTMTYENPPGADQWHFRRDALGCWQIVRFTYNAHTQQS